MDSNFRLMLDELQQMEARLSDRIDGRCSGLERRVVEVEQKAEERLVSRDVPHRGGVGARRVGEAI
jgi:hypothetical protein